jgi:hypothetical protein
MPVTTIPPLSADELAAMETPLQGIEAALFRSAHFLNTEKKLAALQRAIAQERAEIAGRQDRLAAKQLLARRYR